MKTKLLMISLIVLCLTGASCQVEELDKNNPDVDQFVSVLKSGQYRETYGHELPDFSERHIERLLFYVNDTSIVNQFPSNIVSSKYTQPKILNECLLWTIDGIRLGKKYPSLEPCLIDTSTLSEFTIPLRISGKKLIELSGLYVNWYKEYQANPSEILWKKDLLENTPYRWN